MAFIDPDEVIASPVASKGFVDPDTFKDPDVVSTKPTETTKKKELSFGEVFGPKGGISPQGAAGGRSAGEALGELATDVADIPASIPAFLGAGAAGLAAAVQHSAGHDRRTGTHFGAGSAVADAVMEKYGTPVRKILTSAGVLPKAKEGQTTSPVASAMGAIGKAIETVADGVGDLTNSQEAKDATKFGLTYLAPGVLGKTAHDSFKTEMGKASKAPVAEQVDPSTHVQAWQEQLDNNPTPAVVKETAFRNKETGEITPTGPKHPTDMKEETASTHEQGFLDEKGNFLDRKEALARAVETKQIPEDHFLDDLHSTDLRDAGDVRFKTDGDQTKPVYNTPHPSTVTDQHDFNAKGMQVLKDQGPEAANKFAQEVVAYKRNFGTDGAPLTPKDLEDNLYRLGKNKEADAVETSRMLKEAQKAGVDLPMKERWLQHAEGTLELSQEEQALFNKYYEPLQSERKGLIEHAQKKGWVFPTELADDVTGKNVARMVVPKQMNVWEKFKQNVAGVDKGGFDVNIEKKPGAAQERGFFVAEMPSGKRVVIQAKGDKVLQWNGQKASVFSAKDTPLKAGGKIGRATIKEARQGELETHTPYKYNKDSQAVLYQRVNELRDFVRAKQQIEDIKASPFFKANSHKVDPHQPLPEGFRIPKYIDKVPEFAGLAFEKHTADIIEDFAKNWTPNALTLISGTLIKNMMLNPLPHMLNEAWHSYNARGLTGWVTPAGVARFVKTGMPAVKEVMTQGEQFRSMLRDGASLLSAGTRNNLVQDSFMKKGMKEFVDGPDGRSLAEKIGMKPVELYDALSKKANAAMWVTRDAMYMQLINEKMQKGMSQKEAITEVERHMPAYRIPTEVMGSRRISEVLQNPNVTVFSRYHYGMMKSLYETAMDMSGKRGKAAFLDGADTAVAIAVALAVLYPAQDMLAQALTGNDKASVRRAGPYHPMTAIADIARGEKDPQAFLASVFTFNPALLGGAQLIFDRKLYNGQPIYHPTDSAGDIAKDVSNYAFTQVPQVSTYMRTSSDKGGGLDQWLAQQIDIKSPSTAETKAKERIKRKAFVASKNRELKERNKH